MENILLVEATFWPNFGFYISLLLFSFSASTFPSLFFRLGLSSVLVVCLGFLYFPIPGHPHREPKVVKVFNIGLSLTGDATLAKFMHDEAGYVSVHAPLNLLHFSSSQPPIINWKVSDGYDFLGGEQVALRFEELAQHYPTSLFLVTQRNASSEWAQEMESLMSRFADFYRWTDVLFEYHAVPISYHRLFQHLYGVNYTRYRKEEWENVFVLHQQKVDSYFLGSERVLRINVFHEEERDTLLSFLKLKHTRAKREFDFSESWERILLLQTVWNLENLATWLFQY